MKHPKLALLPLLLAAACAGRQPTAQPAQPESAAVAECRAEARSSPAVQETWREWVPFNMPNNARVNDERAEAERRAFNDCLRRRGLSRGGGVEPVRRPSF
jgi:hypothetical protein